jgi:hypothetical protein
MQQKNGKIVAKREPKVKKEHKASYVPAYSSNNVFEDEVVRHEAKPVKRALKQESTDDESEYASSPVKRNR